MLRSDDKDIIFSTNIFLKSRPVLSGRLLCVELICSFIYNSEEAVRAVAAAFICRRGKSGLHRAGCLITSGGSDPKESATESIPLLYAVRVKWQCKRLPVRR